MNGGKKFNGLFYQKASNLKIFNKCVILLVSSIVFLYNYLADFIINWNMVILTACCVLFISIYLTYISRKNWSLFIIFACIAYFNYSICVANYFWIIPNNFFTSLATDNVSIIGINILLLFMISILLFFPNKIYGSKEISIFISRKNENQFFCIGISIVLILIFIFEFSMPTIEGERGWGSPLSEYSIIFFIIGFYYSGCRTRYRIVFSIIMFMFVSRGFIYGGRVEGLQLIMTYFLIMFSHKVSFRRVLPLAFIGLILLQGIGMFRASFSLSIDSINKILERLMEEKMVLDTAYAAYYASLVSVKVHLFSTVNQRIYLLERFLLSIFLGSSRVSDSILPWYTTEYYSHYGGTLLPFYFYFYMKWIGVLLSSIIVGLYVKMINLCYIKCSDVCKCIAIYLSASVFRWYLYSPLVLLRGVLLLILAFYLSKITNIIITRGNHVRL